MVPLDFLIVVLEFQSILMVINLCSFRSLISCFCVDICHSKLEVKFRSLANRYLVFPTAVIKDAVFFPPDAFATLSRQSWLQCVCLFLGSASLVRESVLRSLPGYFGYCGPWKCILKSGVEMFSALFFFLILLWLFGVFSTSIRTVKFFFLVLWRASLSI